MFIRKRDEAAFAEIVRRHGPVVLGVCRRVLRNSADADDAFQATFLVLATKAAAVRQPGLLGNWLFGVAARVASAARRANQRRSSSERQLMQETRIIPSTADTACDQEIVGLLDEEIHRLTSKLRIVVVLCYLEGKTRIQAAEQLGWPEGTVATRLAQAREILRKRLAKRGITSSADAFSSALSHGIAPAMVTPALLSSTVKAATAIAAGKAAVTGAVSAKAAGLAKGFSKAMFAVKIKIAALIVVGSSLALAVSAQVAQTKAPPVVVAQAVPGRAPVAARSESDISATRTLRVLHAINVYTNDHNGHFPPDLGATLPYCPVAPNEKAQCYVLPADEQSLDIPEHSTPKWINEHASFAYLADENLTRDDLHRLKPEERTVVVIYQRPGLVRDHPISVGLSDDSANWMAPPVAKQFVEETLTRLARVRQTPRPASTRALAAEGFGPDQMPHFSEPSLPAKAIPLPDVVRNALSKNAADMGPLTIAWTETGSCPLGQEKAKAAYYMGDGYFAPWSRKTAWQGGQIYTFALSVNGNVNEVAFNGTNLAFTNSPQPGRRKQAANTNPIEKLLKTNPDMPYIGVDYFDCVGLRLPATVRQLAAGVAEPKLLSMLAGGAQLVGVADATLDGQLMTRVTVVADNPMYATLHTLPRRRTYVFWLDPRMNYALRRMEQKYGEQPVEVTNNENFEQLAGRSVWLPRKSTTDYFTFRMIPDKFFGHPILSRVMDVSAIDVAPIPDDRFVLGTEIPAEANALAVAGTPGASADTVPTAVIARPVPRRSYATGPIVAITALLGVIMLAILARLYSRA